MPGDLDLLRTALSCRVLLAYVSHTVESTLSLAATGDEVHGPIAAELDVGHVQGRASQKHLGCSHVARSAGLPVDSENASV